VTSTTRSIAVVGWAALGPVLLAWLLALWAYSAGSHHGSRWPATFVLLLPLMCGLPLLLLPAAPWTRIVLFCAYLIFVGLLAVAYDIALLCSAFGDCM
jgi:hypothetical protein